ncbi:MAG: hypothetical protein V3S32_01490 [Acidimicrobiia bacterium]
MARKMLGVFTAVAAAMVLVGVAWAGTDGAAEELSSTEVTAATILDEGVTAPTTADDEDNDTTSTSIHDDEDDDDTTTSTTISGGTTTTSIHDDEDDDDDDSSTSTSIHHDDNDEVEVFEDQRVVYDIPGVGRVTVEIIDGRLELVNISARGWDIEIERAEADRVEVEFERGSDEVEFEARVDHGKIEIEIELESS